LQRVAMMTEARRPVRIANCSGFFGDRLSAAREMVDGGPIDVLTGDWLAELTMLILARQRMKHGVGSGYARTFLTQMKDVLGDCLDRDIKVVTDAGGLDPQGLADALADAAGKAGLQPRIAVVTGDDISDRVGELTENGEEFRNLDTDELFAEMGTPSLAANAYLGGRAITAALAAGADVVIAGRVTDAALAIGPAAWWHGWDYEDPADLDRFAGALVAGHVIECGAQATGGNYSFFTDVPGVEHIGFPIAEIGADGTSVITKHPGTGGLVSPGTVTAQLLYEVGDAVYLNPDVSADFRSIQLDQVGRDRVRISGVVGAAPPDRLKVSLNYLGGFRNSMTLVLTGLDIEAKADVALRTIAGITLADCKRSPAELAATSTLSVAELTVDLLRADSEDPTEVAAAQAHLRLTVKDSNPDNVGKAFTARAVESALASYPGMFPTAVPTPGTPYGVFWPTTVAGSAVTATVSLAGEEIASFPGGSPLGQATLAEPSAVISQAADQTDPAEMVRIPLGWVAGARSGDKGGNANVGVWIPDPVEIEAVALAGGEADSLTAPDVNSADDMSEIWLSDDPLQVDPAADERADRSYQWLLALLQQPGAVQRLIPEAAGLQIEVVPLPNLRAVNLVITGLLGRGVSENALLDPQAKGLGEYLRSRQVSFPRELLDTDNLGAT
jgi:hypothetical protein